MSGPACCLPDLKFNDLGGIGRQQRWTATKQPPCHVCGVLATAPRRQRRWRRRHAGAKAQRRPQRERHCAASVWPQPSAAMLPCWSRRRQCRAQCCSGSCSGSCSAARVASSEREFSEERREARVPRASSRVAMIGPQTHLRPRPQTSDLRPSQAMAHGAHQRGHHQQLSPVPCLPGYLY